MENRNISITDDTTVCAAKNRPNLVEKSRHLMKSTQPTSLTPPSHITSHFDGALWPVEIVPIRQMDLHTISTEPFVSDTNDRRHWRPRPKRKQKRLFFHSDHTRHVVSLKSDLLVSHTTARNPPSLNVLYASVISYYPHPTSPTILNAALVNPTRNFAAALSRVAPVD